MQRSELETILLLDVPEGQIDRALKNCRPRAWQLKRCNTVQQLLELIEYSNPAAIVVNCLSITIALEQCREILASIEEKPWLSLLIVGNDFSLPEQDRESPYREVLSTMDAADGLYVRLDSAAELSRLYRSLNRAKLSSDRYRATAEVLWSNSGEGILYYDNEGYILTANPKALRTLDYSVSQLISLNIFDLFHATNSSKLVQEALDEQVEQLRKSIEDGRSFNSGRMVFRTQQSRKVVAEVRCTQIHRQETIPSNSSSSNDETPQLNVMIFHDITARTLNEERLIKLAKYDVLTGLSNRSKFHDFTEGKIAYCAHNNKRLALLFIDIDNFKNINDTMGHDIGDELLLAVAERLRKTIRESDLVARIGGDEFAITLLDIGSPNQVTRIVKNIQSVIREPLNLARREISVTASFGISLYPESGPDIRTLTQSADTALYQAKEDGRNTYKFFSSEIQERVVDQSNLEDALRIAINRDEFFLVYQPQIDACTGRVVGLEALIRWQHPNWPGIGPHRFIPIAEECGLLPEIGQWVLYTACQQAMAWHGDEELLLDFPISVNLSPKQLITGEFLQLLEEVLENTGLPATKLVLELTETAVMKNPEVAISMLNEIDRAGVMISVDDFGTGYSSLNYLKRLPIHKIKIDRSFVQDIGHDQNGEAIVKAILALAHSLNLQVIAEGVEEQSQVDFLRELECEVFQGYFFHTPMDTTQIRQLLMAEKKKWGGIDLSAGGDPGSQKLTRHSWH